MRCRSNQEEQPALRRATWLATSTGATLDLLICYYNQQLGDVSSLESTSLKDVQGLLVDGFRRKLAALAEPLAADGVDVETNIVWEHPLADGIVAHAVSSGADVIFKEAHHHSAIARTLFTSTDWRLLRTCPCPVWFVLPGEISGAPAILASVDPMHEHDKPASLDTSIVSMSSEIASTTSGEVNLFHAYDPRAVIYGSMAAAYAPVSMPIDEMESAEKRRHEKKFVEFADAHDIPEEQRHLVPGLTYEKLPDLVNKLEIDLVVMGSISRGRVKQFFIGATAEQVLARVPCDLLVVKPEWFRTPLEIATENVA